MVPVRPGPETTSDEGIPTISNEGQEGGNDVGRGPKPLTLSQDQVRLLMSVLTVLVFSSFTVGFFVRRFHRFLLLTTLLTVASLAIASRVGYQIRTESPVLLAGFLGGLVPASFHFVSTPSFAGLVAAAAVVGFLIGAMSRHRFASLKTVAYPLLLAFVFTGAAAALEIEIPRNADNAMEQNGPSNSRKEQVGRTNNQTEQVDGTAVETRSDHPPMFRDGRLDEVTFE